MSRIELNEWSQKVLKSILNSPEMHSMCRKAAKVYEAEKERSKYNSFEILR